jgi:hypothetical protein
MKTISAFVLATVASALTACGGEGSDPNRPIDPAPLRVTSGNQTTVARAALSSGFAVARTSSVSTTATDRAGAQSATNAGTGGAAGALDGAVRAALTPWLAQRRSTIQSAGAHPAAAVAAPPETCANGGTRSANFDDRDNNSATSAGDVVTVTFAACSFDQVVLDGTMVVNVTAVSATSLSGSMQFQQVKVTSGSMKTTIAGAADVTETDDGSHTDTAIVVGAAGLSIAVASPSYSDTVSLVNTFTIDTSASDTADGATVRIDGPFTASSLPSLDGHALRVDTVAPLVVSATSGYPASGQLRIKDDYGGVLLLTVTDATKVHLQLDADGNDTYESDTSVAWSALLPN